MRIIVQLIAINYNLIVDNLNIAILIVGVLILPIIIVNNHDVQCIIVDVIYNQSINNIIFLGFARW